ncbi:thiol-disulfide oxidoreductase LTO1 isoform X1 [Pyrus x bretschneideri]|uniref:thiol-disulfide oxidoreductase LTO1 isoform X1 n=1 Tax=Pyrus x bretschneideri TaxID=225117 RepID=UPI00202EC1C5|nr:thiol-disulfide oxidoreductase LTO1 isoform X1 [Pyrus x bretschneideri]
MATLAFASVTSLPFLSSRRSPSTHGRFQIPFLHKTPKWGQRSLLLPITCSSTEPNQNADDSEPKTASLAPSSSSDLTYKLYAGLGGVGFLETTYLTYLKLTNSNAFCPTAGGGGEGSCGDILSSDYAVVFGVPLPLFGMVAYGLVATMGVQLLTAKKLPFGIDESNARLVLLGTTTSMAAASACFLYILSTKFSGASCSYCLLSALLSFTLFFTALKDFGLEKVQKEVGLLFCIASLVVVTLNRSYSALPPVPSRFGFDALSIHDHILRSPSEIDLPYFSTEITTPSSPFAIALAKHLSAIGAKMYGAFWCSHCVEQKQMFGSEAAKLLNYVECFPGGFRKGTIMQKECFDVQIEGFPTWVINGQVLSGEKELMELAQESGFDLKEFNQTP